MGHTAEIVSLNFSTEGDRIITGSFDHTTKAPAPPASSPRTPPPYLLPAPHPPPASPHTDRFVVAALSHRRLGRLYIHEAAPRRFATRFGMS